MEIFLGASTWWLVPFKCLYVFGLYGMFRKCGVKPWKAFIPFVRNYELAVCADHEMEGRVVLVVNFLDMVMTLIGDGIGIHYPTAVVLLVAILTWIIPSGSYDYQDMDINGRIREYLESREE